MADWTLLLCQTPANRLAGSPGSTGLITPLTLATNVSVSMHLDSVDTLTFQVPGRHYHTALMTTGSTDVIAFRDDKIIQRFRVTARSFSSESGNLTCQVTCSSYREIINQWVFHDESPNIGHRDWDTPTEQTAIAWQIIKDGMAKANGNIGLDATTGRGVTPAVSVNITAHTDDTTADTQAKYFFSVGESRGAGIQRLADGGGTLSGALPAGTLPGFDWSIDPDPADPMRSLKFNAWNKEKRRRSTTLVAPFLLSEASLAGYSFTEDMANYADVVHVHGTAGEVLGQTYPAPEVWRPTDKNPSGALAQGRGRWEIDLDSSLDDITQLNPYADNEFRKYTEFSDEWQVSLQPGRWQGPDDFWIGDNVKMLIKVEGVDDEGKPVTSVDGSGNPTEIVVFQFPPTTDVTKTLRVQEVTIAVSSNGSENVSVGLNRPPFSVLDEIQETSRRLANLEREANR